MINDPDNLWIWIFAGLVGSCPFDHKDVINHETLEKLALRADEITAFIYSRKANLNA